MFVPHKSRNKEMGKTKAAVGVPTRNKNQAVDWLTYGVGQIPTQHSDYFCESLWPTLVTYRNRQHYLPTLAANALVNN